ASPSPDPFSSSAFPSDAQVLVSVNPAATGMNNFSFVQFTGRQTSSIIESEPLIQRRRPKSPPTTPAPRDRHADAPPLNDLLSSILTRNNLPHDAYRPTAMERRLPAVQRRLRVSTQEAARERLRNEPHLLPEALSVLLIGVTGFFRDRPVFAALR